MNAPDSRSLSKLHSTRLRKSMNYWFGKKRDGFYHSLGFIAAFIYLSGLAVTEYEITSSWEQLSSRLKAAGFLSMLVVIALILIHRNIHELHQFLELFRQADHLPQKQIAHVNSFCMTIFLGGTLLLSAIIPPLLDPMWTAIAAWFKSIWKPVPIEPPEMGQMMQEQSPQPSLTEIFGEPEPPPAWLEVAEKIFIFACWIFIAAILFFLIRSMLHSIWGWITKPRHFDDDEKIYLKPVFSLAGEHPSDNEKAHEPRGLRWYLSYNNRIRRLYRKEILSGHGRGRHPQEWATPTELESSAGLNNQTLHELYEKARYSHNSCTEEDWKKLN